MGCCSPHGLNCATLIQEHLCCDGQVLTWDTTTRITTAGLCSVVESMPRLTHLLLSNNLQVPTAPSALRLRPSSQLSE